MITDLDIENLICPPEKLSVSISEMNLEFVARSTGVKTVYARFYHKKKYRAKIGVWGENIRSIDEAIALQEKWQNKKFAKVLKNKALKKKEENLPICIKNVQTFTPKRFDECFYLWQDNYKSKVSPITHQVAISRAKRYFLSQLSNASLSRIKINNIIPIFKPLENRPILLSKVITILNSILNYAVLLQAIPYNPCIQLLKILNTSKQEVEHRHSINYSEMTNLLNTIFGNEKLSVKNKLLFLLGLCTLLRAKELTTLTWKNLNTINRCICVSPENMKMKKAFRVPYTELIKKIITKLDTLHKEQDIDSDFIFSSKFNKSKPICSDTITNILNKNGYKGILCNHGFRAMARLFFRENNIDFDVAEMCLAHQTGSQTVNAYLRTDLLEERRIALEKWCKYIESCDHNNYINSLLNP